jgi:hypothetical protein
MSSSRRQFLKSTGSLLICFSLPGCSKDGGKSGIGYAYIDQRIRVESSGIVDLSLGKVELGQGIGTALAQIAAEELGVDIERIRLSGVDTDHSPDESYTFSTISVQQSGPLVRPRRDDSFFCSVHPWSSAKLKTAFLSRMANFLSAALLPAWTTGNCLKGRSFVLS